jgi:hypothetical protein
VLVNDLSVAQLLLHPPENKGSVVRLAASLLETDGSQQQLWWELPDSVANVVTTWADPWVVAFLFPIMQRRRGVHINGPVTPSLLAQLDRFMHVWAMWRPDKYQPAELIADEIIEQPPATNPGVAVASFSCGLDSCFTVYRHTRGLAGRHSRPIGLGIMQHGFDVRLDQENSFGMFRSLVSDATVMLDSLGIPCIPMTTNFRLLDLDWADAYATQLVAGMMLLSRGYDTGLLANDLPYFELGPRPWGLHPVTIGLLGADRFKIIEDGFEYSRIDKAKTVASWPQAMRHLRVCFGLHNPGSHENCGVCDKCIRTELAFRVAGCAKPSAFKEEASPRLIRRIRITSSTRATWALIAERAEAAGLGQTPWARAMRTALRRDRYREWRTRLQRPFLPIRSAIRRLTRGTDISRSQMRRLAEAKAAQTNSNRNLPTASTAPRDK